MAKDRTAKKYLNLIRSYTDGQTAAAEFMHEYLDEFKHENITTSDEAFEILNNLFFACDAYCHNTDPQEVRGGIGEKQFFKEAAYARRELEELLNEMDDSDSTE